MVDVYFENDENNENKELCVTQSVMNACGE